MHFDPKDIVEHLRHNLERYPYGNGISVFRELLQNADDAKAHQVSLHLRPGWPEASNPLLRGPGLLLVNDGEFDERSATGMQTFGGSVKALDDASVGRFGLGQKSVFHLCDAFAVVPDGFGAHDEPFVVNPFEALGREGDDCLRWPRINDEDARRIASEGKQLLDARRRLNMWFPLRREGLRPKPTSKGIIASDIAPESLAPLADEWRIAEMVASLRHVRRVVVGIGPSNAEIDRGTARAMIGYTAQPGDRSFGGPLGRGIACLGRERRATDDFRRDLRGSQNWPRSRNRDTDEEAPQKATPHGAAILVVDPEGMGQLLADWAVLLPVTEAFPPQAHDGMGRLKLLLHGCFFVDSGRKAVIGLDEAGPAPTDQAPLDETTLRAEWNRSVRDRLVLPLIPAVLYDALQEAKVSGEALGAAVRALAASDFGRTHRAAIAAQHALARIVETSNGNLRVRWQLVASTGTFRPIPAPDARGRVGLADILPNLTDWATERGVTLVCGRDAVLTTKDLVWEADEIAKLLEGLAADCFLSDTQVRVLRGFLETACTNHDLRVAASGPVLKRLRQAMASPRALAPHERIAKVLEVTAPDGVLPLPPGASERFVLRALASAKGAPICLPQEWLPDEVKGATIGAHAVHSLIAALQPLLETDGQADSASAAALAILRRIESIEAALEHPELPALPVVKALDGIRTRRLSLAELYGASREQRLFRDHPQARRLLGVAANALPESETFLLPSAAASALLDANGSAPTNAVFRLHDLDARAVCALVRKAEALGPPQARANLLNAIFSNELESRDALLMLAAGDRRAHENRFRLNALGQSAPALDALIARLTANSEPVILVPSEVMDTLDRAKVRHLSIDTLEGAWLGDLLVRHADELATQGLDHAAVEAILCAGIPDEHLKQLPIFPTRQGGWARPDSVYRPNPDWAVARGMTAIVPLLGEFEEPRARERAEALVERWSPEAQIAVCLGQSEPIRFSTEILDALASIEAPDADRLRRAKWLRDRSGNAWAPEDVVDLSEDVLVAARRVLGDDLPFLPVSDIDPRIREHQGFADLREKGVLPDDMGSLDRLLLIIEEARPVAFVGGATDELVQALAQLADAGVDLPLPGWPLLAAALRVLPPDAGETPARMLEVVTRFKAADRAQHRDVANWLNELAEIAKQRHGTNEAAAARVAYSAAFKMVASWPVSEFRAIIGGVFVPTDAGNWRRGAEVTAPCEGISRDFLLAADLAKDLPPNSEPAGPEAGQSEGGEVDKGNNSNREECVKSLVSLLKRMRAQVPEPALAFFAAVVSERDQFERIASDCFALPHATIQSILNRLDEIAGSLAEGDKGTSYRFALLRKNAGLHFTLITGGEVKIMALDGNVRSAPSEIDQPFQVLGTGHLEAVAGNRGTVIHEITIADREGRITLKTLEDLTRNVGPLVLWHFKRCEDAILEELRQAFQVGQATVEDARARLEDRLPQILAELKPAPGSRLREALDRYETQEQSIPPDKRAKELPDAKRALWDEVASEDSATELLGLIRQGIESYGYGPGRVAFELFQNADDATLQHPPEGLRAFRVAFENERMRILHWGRLINHLGPSSAEGERRGWQRDLFNMLLMNLSEKREDVTGRFGLGFKSVHLIACEVEIASGFIACRIKGGMLPEVWEGGQQHSLDASRNDRRATIISLKIDPDPEREAQEAHGVFARCARWLPVTARAIREVHLGGHRYAARLKETGMQGIRHVVFEGVEPGQALALSLDDNTTLYLPLDTDGPRSLPEEMPRLWLLAPLEEEIRAGWLLNSYSFRVDPGRGRLAGSVKERAELFERLGRALGHRLVELFDLLDRDWAGFAEPAGLSERNAASGRKLFLERLVSLFKEDVSHGGGDDRLETKLHHEGGLRHLFCEREAFPTRLPAPFEPFLRADQVRWKLAGGLVEPGRVERLIGWRSVADIAQSAVSSEMATVFEHLGFPAPQRFDAAMLVSMEIGADKRADPESAARLGSFLDQPFVEALDWKERQELLKAAAGAKFLMADGQWREARLVPRDAADADEEERRILAFAPNEDVADDSYFGDALSFYRLAARQSGYQRTAETFARWAHQVTEPAAQRALLTYVAEGSQGERLGNLLATKRPHWLPAEAEEFRQSELAKGFDDDARGRLMPILYPSLRRMIGSGRWLSPDPGSPEIGNTPPDPAEELARIRDWWLRDHVDQREDYDNRIWPNGFRPGSLRDLEAEDNRVGWFTFFALGIFRTLPWNNEGAHKSFVESAARAGWWDEMATARLPEDPTPWLKRLEDFASPAAWKIDFPQWRRTIADLYALARWLPDYADAFRLLPRVVEREGQVALSDIWRLSYAPIWQRRGLEGAPLTQSLGLGANWMIREAIRHGLWGEDEAARMHTYAWAATGRVRRLFAERLGHPLGERGNMDLSRDIYSFVSQHLGPDVTFLGDLDLPLQLWESGEDDATGQPVYSDEARG
ncbi:sacsin N-terminal ATP-binding-like domain-containing protein [Parvularcula lutaonensis]|uniref:Sacsin N-terminal ATP-binding-like domain-containing protein n=1 Tax=Parvularcula lutaonensis TaxID=491923 RepID=A0ABV7MBM6_9PROT|nr:hypothetical protein [Parvularcula lutaonensis]GGY37654.1 hypothetical protein GCM10007148_02410 [Parvularcula lutaonensis]